MAQGKARIVGSAYTALQYRGKAFQYLDSFTDTAPAPVTPAVEIHPLDAEYPVEFALPKAMTGGTLEVTLIEWWTERHWERLPGFKGAKTLLDVLKRSSSLGGLTATKIIKAPDGSMRSRVYHNLTLVGADDGETVNIGAMQLPRKITFKYTHYTE